LSEAECYLRCYGWAGGDDAVRVLREGDTPTPAESTRDLTERIRIAFEARLDSREAEAA
jgi:hypothetical protein